ncbi:MAG: DUF2330 domain-containing protein [Propionibacteriaceae bacterium]|nr:DUF2330 domain-containing protein [Propionibacteriaceae bacterium]
MRRLFHSVVGLLIVLGGTWLPAPARACACGAVITNSDAAIDSETALIVRDGSHQRTDMVMHLDGEASEAAWIMPLPPGGTVSLGDKSLFESLKELTKPRPTYELEFFPDDRAEGSQSLPSAAASDPQVRVVGIQTVGPFEVTTLEGNRADAVTDWLVANGFPGRRDVEPTFQEYLDADWRVIAVRLTPGEESSALAGGLDSLRLEFDSQEAIYPIKLSRHAKTRQGVKLYVLADHRMETQGPTENAFDTRVKFAAKVPIDTLNLGDGERFLTLIEGSFEPKQIVSDIQFTQATTDETNVPTYVVKLPIWQAYPVALLVAAVVALSTWLLLRHRKRVQSHQLGVR